MMKMKMMKLLLMLMMVWVGFDREGFAMRLQPCGER